MASEGQLHSEGRDLRTVKMRAKERFGNVRGVDGFGIGDRTIRVYVRDASVRASLPRTFEGVEVEVVVVGDIVAQHQSPSRVSRLR